MVPAVLTLVLAVLVAIPAAILLTPSRDVTVAGQQLGVRGTTPASGWFGGWSGPARLKQIGETVVDLRPIQVRGPLRPEIQVGPLVKDEDVQALLDPRHGPKARNAAIDAVTGAFRAWYVLATLLLLGITAGLLAVTVSVRIWVVMFRASRHREHPRVAEVWRSLARRLRVTGAVTLVGVLVVWAGLGLLAAHDTAAGLSGIHSPRDLLGAEPVRIAPAGPPVRGYAGAVIGDSRVSRVGGPLVPHPTPDDRACARSSDSLAAQLTRLDPSERVRNLACPGASISQGLLGSQSRNGRTMAPQVSRLLRMRGLRFVVVMVGPNDLDWTDFLSYCYAYAGCNDKVSSGQFDYRLARFDRDYGDLLASLATLRGHPRIVVVGSYDVFSPDAECADTKGPQGVPGLNPDSIALLQERNHQLNDVLRTGAEAYSFDFVTPQLEPLCEHGDPEVGADIQGLHDAFPFHPTAVGIVRLAASVFAGIATAEDASDEPTGDATAAQ